jgi:hypothetical protein
MYRLAEAPGMIDPAELTPLVACPDDVHQTRWLSPVLGSRAGRCYGSIADQSKARRSV